MFWLIMACIVDCGISAKARIPPGNTLSMSPAIARSNEVADSDKIRETSVGSCSRPGGELDRSSLTMMGR